MNTQKTPGIPLFKAVIIAVLFFSALGLLYYIRWFIPFLQNREVGIVPKSELPLVWFIVQIGNNIIFLTVGLMLMRLFQKYQQLTYFDKSSIKVFDQMIVSCFLLAGLGFFQSIMNNISELHLTEWTSFNAIVNLLFRSFTRLFIFRNPQTMYLLLAMILWAVKNFISKAIVFKTENEAFI